MGQIVLDLDDVAEAALRARAAAEGKSVSDYVAQSIGVAPSIGWPQWWLSLPVEPDFPTAEEIRKGDPSDAGPPHI
jgi:hypothetical protein